MNPQLDERQPSDRLVVYSRYFARIPKYLRKAIRSFKRVEPYVASIKIISPNIERIFFYLGLGVISYEIWSKYIFLKNSEIKNKNLHLLDTILWHCLASFLLPTLVIDNSVHYLVAGLNKVTNNKKLQMIASVGLSILWIYFIMNPIDNLSNFILENSYRKYLNYKKEKL
jgi:hypothetical protein